MGMISPDIDSANTCSAELFHQWHFINDGSKSLCSENGSMSTDCLVLESQHMALQMMQEWGVNLITYMHSLAWGCQLASNSHRMSGCVWKQ